MTGIPASQVSSAGDRGRYVRSVQLIHFKPYPIVINGSYLDEDERLPYEVIANLMPFRTRRDNPWTQASIRANRWDFTPDNRPRAKEYDDRVFRLLTRISHTEIGHALLTCLPKNFPIWIIPYDSLNQRVFSRLAAVTQLKNNNKPSDGVMIQFSPEMWCPMSCGGPSGQRADETLLHELVHACRNGNITIGHGQLDFTEVADNNNREEFFAFMLQNVFLSETGEDKLWLQYESSDKGPQADLELYLSTGEDTMTALETFSLYDPLAKWAMRLRRPRFNPFRDLERLKKARADFLKSSNPPRP